MKEKDKDKKEDSGILIDWINKADDDSDKNDISDEAKQPQAELKEEEIKKDDTAKSDAIDTAASEPSADAANGEGDDWLKSVYMLPKGVYAHFMLVDIAGPVKEARGIPRYFTIERTKTLIGRYVKAHVFIDDPRTVAPKHAKVVYEDASGKKEFVIYPIDNSRIEVNGKPAPGFGIVLKNGDNIKIGSAELIFFKNK